MICKVCNYSLDSCCRDFTCCTCAKKEFNRRQREEYNSNSEIDICQQCGECNSICECKVIIQLCNDENLIYRESKYLTCTIANIALTKVTLPIIPHDKCSSSKYLIEWSCEVGTTDTAIGQAQVIVTQNKIPECPDNTLTLINTRLNVNKDFWTPYSGFKKIVLESPTLIELSFASSNSDNSKNVCIRNAVVKALRIG